MPGGFEPSHLALALSRWLMRNFRSIVFVLPGAMDHGRHCGTVRRRVAAELIRDQTARCTALSFQQFPEETGGRPLIAPGLHEEVDHVAVLIDRPPQILLAPLDGQEQFSQVPDVTHPAASSPKTAGILSAKGLTPLPNGLIGHRDAALG